NIDELCKAARIAKGSFYRHYHSKDQIFFAAAEEAAREVAEGFASISPSRAPGEGKTAREELRQAPPEDSWRERAAEALARAMEPRLPIVLELLAGAARKSPGYA